MNCSPGLMQLVSHPPLLTGGAAISAPVAVAIARFKGIGALTASTTNSRAG